MCGRITIVEFDELLGIARAIEYGAPLNAQPDWPVRDADAFPNSSVPLLIVSQGGAQVASATGGPDLDEEEAFAWNRTSGSALQDDDALVNRMDMSAFPNERRIVSTRKLWGFETEGRTQVVFNTRIETAEERPLWKDSIEQRRCIIPVRAFYETHRNEKGVDLRTGRVVKQAYRFASADDLLLFAGIWKGDRFSIVTTPPNESVAAVHDRMPLILSAVNAREWLLGDWRGVARANGLALSRQPLYAPQPTVEQPRLF